MTRPPGQAASGRVAFGHEVASRLTRWPKSHTVDTVFPHSSFSTGCGSTCGSRSARVVLRSGVLIGSLVTRRWSKGDSNSPSHPERRRSKGHHIGSRVPLPVSESGPPENAIVSAGISATAPAAASLRPSWRSNALTPTALSSLPACGDFDIEKMRPEWRDEVYQNWRAVRRLRLKHDGAREVGQLCLVRPGRRGPLSAR
jgi:hypothetical protein